MLVGRVSPVDEEGQWRDDSVTAPALPQAPANPCVADILKATYRVEFRAGHLPGMKRVADREGAAGASCHSKMCGVGLVYGQ